MILRNLWDKATAKLGRFAAFLPMLGEQIRIDLEEQNVESITKRTHELRESAAALVAMADALDAAVADGVLDANEGAEVLAKLDVAIDEIEDVFTGEDEDDPPAAV
jgi:cytochrome b